MIRLALLACLALAACGGASSRAADRTPSGARRVPPKPGESITHTRMCSCKACQPASCCRELEQDVPGSGRCDGYDFSKCGLSVSSCQASCFEHRWRIRVEQICEKTLPAVCC